MTSEFVKLTPLEIVYGETNLLQSQLSILTAVKQHQEYKILRKQELLLKIELKKKIGELKEFLDTLNKALPESKFLKEQEERDKIQREITNKIENAVQTSRKKEWTHWKEKKSTVKKKTNGEKPQSLDQELEDIRKKLEKLQ